MALDVTELIIILNGPKQREKVITDHEQKQEYENILHKNEI
jgi:hypothetical protein